MQVIYQCNIMLLMDISMVLNISPFYLFTIIIIIIATKQKYTYYCSAILDLKLPLKQMVLKRWIVNDKRWNTRKKILVLLLLLLLFFWPPLDTSLPDNNVLDVSRRVRQHIYIVEWVGKTDIIESLNGDRKTLEEGKNDLHWSSMRFDGSKPMSSQYQPSL